MPYRKVPFTTDYFYHIFNRGVEKRTIFSSEKDYQHFLQTLNYYQFSGPKPKFSNRTRFKNHDFTKNPKIVDIICYCLMPNHFHLLLRQTYENGITEFMQKIINSYTKYYNIKHNRIGHLFQGVFKAVFIESNEQLQQVSRYIHLNPYVSEITSKLESYNYSSYPHFIGSVQDPLCVSEPVMSLFRNSEGYKEFVRDHADYAKEIERFKHVLLDPEE